MKKLCVIFCWTALLLCTACAAPGWRALPTAESSGRPPLAVEMALRAPTEPVQDDMEPVLQSYCAAQSEPAFAYIQKRRIQRFLTEHFTPAAIPGIQNQQWNFDSFTKYVLFDGDGNPVSSDDLYYCTFGADHDRYGFIVVKHFPEAPAIQNQGVEETPYLYDLQANLDVIAEKLYETELDLSSATAARGRLGADEIILFTDGTGSRYVCYLDSFDIVQL